MATTRKMTVREIVTAALRKAGVLAWGEALAHDDAQAAMGELEAMLKGWQNEGYNLWTRTSGTHYVLPARPQELDPVRPLDIHDVRVVEESGFDRPLVKITRDEYDRIPNKDAEGTPTQFYYDRQAEKARLYIWPMPFFAGAVLNFTYTREVDDITDLNQDLDAPGEWWDAIIYGLAARIAETVPIGQPQAITLRAEQLLRKAGAFDREDSVYFAGPWAD